MDSCGTVNLLAHTIDLYWLWLNDRTQIRFCQFAPGEANGAVTRGSREHRPSAAQTALAAGQPRPCFLFLASPVALPSPHHNLIYCRYFLMSDQVTGVFITRLGLVTGVGSTDMSLWLIPVGIAAWFLVAVAVGLCVGPVLGYCSQARKAVGRQWMRASGAPEPTRKDRQVSPGLPGAGVSMARRDQNVTL